jgi:hypothetical protein
MRKKPNRQYDSLLKITNVGCSEVSAHILPTMHLPCSQAEDGTSSLDDGPRPVNDWEARGGVLWSSLKLVLGCALVNAP